MSSKLQSRGSSPKTPSRRPRLMRAAATCPQLATSNASRNDLATLNTYGAATILNRVANYSTAQHEHTLRHSPQSTCSSPGTSPESATRKEPYNITHQQSGHYFSFPSFEDFLEFEESEERRQKDSVP